MKEIVLLTKILFKGSSTSNKNTYTNNLKKRKGLGKIFIYIFAYLYIAGLITYMSYQAINSLMEIHQENIFLKISFIGMFFFIFLQTSIISLNILYFSKDIEFLLPLPIKPQKIVMAKLNCLIISQYIICGIILIPILLVYGILLNMGIMYYIMCLFIILLFPIIPVSIMSCIITIIMKFTNIIRNKDFVQYFTVILTIILTGIIFTISGTTSNEITNEQLANILIETDNNLRPYSIVFISINPIINIIENYNNITGMKNTMILFGESIFFYITMSFIISKLYIKSAIASMSSGIKNKKKILKENDYSSNKLVLSYLNKEIKNLVRNPIFFMQCVVPTLLFPIMMTVSTYFSINNSEDISEIIEFQNQVFTYINSSKGLGVIISIITFFFTFNFISVTAISRDGNNATFMKYIPIDLDKQIFYKILPGIILNTLPIIYVIIFTKLIANVLYIKNIIYIILISELINIFNNYCMILIDLKNPKLKWISEQSVVKQNLNMIFEILITIIEVLFIIAISFKLYNINLLSGIIILIFSMLVLVIIKFINKNKTDLFAKII